MANVEKLTHFSRSGFKPITNLAHKLAATFALVVGAKLAFIAIFKFELNRCLQTVVSSTI